MRFKEIHQRTQSAWHRYREQRYERGKQREFNDLYNLALKTGDYTTTRLSELQFGIEGYKYGHVLYGISISQLDKNSYRVSAWKYQDPGGSWSYKYTHKEVVFLLTHW